MYNIFRKHKYLKRKYNYKQNDCKINKLKIMYYYNSNKKRIKN